MKGGDFTDAGRKRFVYLRCALLDTVSAGQMLLGEKRREGRRERRKERKRCESRYAFLETISWKKSSVMCVSAVLNA